MVRYGPVLLGSIFLLSFYWRGLNCWFYQDDFGWLHLGPATGLHDFFLLLFAPKAHGNIRPWSENLFFYGMKGLFGVNPLPFRMVVFATAIVDFALLATLVRKLTGSALASVAAPILWLANVAVAPALCWTSLYNEIQYLFFVLLAIRLFIGGKYWLQIIVFALGLGSLETAVMYPVIALAYALLFDRTKMLRTLPLFAISAAYTVLHFWAAPGAESGPYAIRLDSRVWQTLAAYVKIVLGPQQLAHFHWMWPAWVTIVGTAVIGAGFILALLLAGRVGLFGLAWFLALLVPVLLLPEHIEDYILTGPAMGLAIILAGALALRPRVAAVVAALYLAVSLPAAWDVTSWNFARSQVAGRLVNGIADYSRAHPDKTLLVTGLSTEQFYAGFADKPFETLGMHNVFLAPGGGRNVDDTRGWLPRYGLPEDQIKSLLAAGKAAVLDVSSGDVRDLSGPSAN